MKKENEKEERIVAAYVGKSSEVFPKILDLHVPKGAQILDVTYGKGVFWKDIDEDNYDLVKSDIDPEKSSKGESIDCRDLPYKDTSFDVVVLDPPHIEGFYRKNEDQLPGTSSHSSFRESYSNGKKIEASGRYHKRVLNMYFKAGEEAHRVLKEEGLLIAKMVDEVCANRQELTHIQVTNYYEDEIGFYTKDLFIQVRETKPSVNNIKNQVHARKNHSYYMVYQKTDKDRSY